jgi:hypothetical protein
MTDHSSAAGPDATTAVAYPEVGSSLSMRALVEEEFRERFVEIHEADGERRLVTGIEVLSPSNKKRNSPGWDQYLRKRQGFFASRSANFIEIDLLRGGERMPMADAWPDSPNRLLVARMQRMPMCQVWQGHFQRALPPIPVPLYPPGSGRATGVAADDRCDLFALALLSQHRLPNATHAAVERRGNRVARTATAAAGGARVTRKGRMG